MSVPYLKDPAAIYRASFDAIRRDVDLTALPEDLRPLAVRIVHAAGDPTLVADLRWSEGAATAARRALAGGATVFCDTAMVAAGVTRRFLSPGSTVICTLDDASVPERAARLGTTRSAAAVDLWDDRLQGAVVAIGNAPTALFHLLERLANGDGPLPACILGFPVGYVGAAESKAALIAAAPCPFIALSGRRGGSALAAAAVNALAAPAAESL